MIKRRLGKLMCGIAVQLKYEKCKKPIEETELKIC